MSYQIRITSNAKAVLDKLEKWPADMLRAIAKAMDHENELTIGYVQKNKLSARGPSTLGVITNRLRKSVTASKARIDGNAVVSAIGSNVAYAAAHEFGFHGIVEVPAHKRRIIAFDRYERRGKNLVKTQSGIRGTVKAHPMKMNITARAPFRTGIEERFQNYQGSISLAIVAGWENPSS